MITAKPLPRRFDLPKIRLWVVAATLVAVALLAYYAVLGYRYWSATGRVNQMTERIDSIQSERLAMAAAMSDSDRALPDAESDFQVQQSKFDISGIGDLLIFLTTVAADTGVLVLTVSQSDPIQLIEGGMSYTSLPMQMDIQGDIQGVFSFVDAVHQRAPAMEVVALRFVSLEGTPLAQLEMTFHTSPKPKAKDPAPAQQGAQPDATAALTP